MTSPKQNILCVCKDPNCPISHGLCHCGCGKQTPVNAKDRADRGYKKGDPAKYLIGHQSISKVIIRDTGRFKIDHVYCRLIPLTRGLYSIVWEADYEWISQSRWYARYDQRTKTYYAARTVRDGNTKEMIYMHRQILGLKPGDGIEIDHADKYATLNNARSNLRLAGDAEQGWNKAKRRDSTTGFKGVHPCNNGKSYFSTIRAHGIVYYLGCFPSAELAGKAYERAAKIVHGTFARTS